MERKAAVLLRKILVDEGHRWVTLIGEPGIGKSYIAQALLQDAFSRPLILDSCTWDKNANPQSVLRAHLPPDAPDGVDVIAGLAAAHDVILFDNMDADTGDWVGTVEALAEVVPCIVTDRKAWGGQKERDVRVGAMPEFAAVELFEQSARDEVESTAASRLASRIVTKLDHNPLAIKIAANRTQILTRKQLVDRLENDLDVLGGAPTAERHSSMREAFASAWAKLSPVDQKVLARTSVFHGNFGLHIFEAVVGHDDVTDPLGSLQRLLESSMLRRVTARIPGGPPGFALSEFVRHYSQFELMNRGEVPDTAKRLIDYVVTRATASVEESTDTDVITPGMTPTQIDKIISALRYAREHAPEATPQLQDILEELSATRNGIQTNLITRDLQTDPYSGNRAEALHRRGEAFLEDGDAQNALKTLKSARVLTDPGAEPNLAHRIHRSMARAHLKQGQIGHALESYQRASALAESSGDIPAEVATRTRLGRLYLRSGNPEEAKRPLRAVLRIMTERAMDRVEGIDRARVLRYLATAMLETGDDEGCRTTCDEALVLADLRTNKRRQAPFRAMMGRLAMRQGEAEQALSHLDAACDAESKASEGTNDIFCDRLSLVLDLGRNDRILTVAEPLRRLEESAHFDPKRTLCLAVADMDLGKYEDALSRLDTALARSQECRDTMGELSSHTFLSCAHAGAGQEDVARLHLRQAHVKLQTLKSDHSSHEALSLLEIWIDLKTGQIDGEEAHRRITSDGNTADHYDIREAALRPKWLEKQLKLAIVEATGSHVSSVDDDSMQIGPECHWFKLPGGARVDMSRKRVLRRLLHKLVTQRLQLPGTPVSIEELFAAAWPEETGIRTDSKANRLHVSLTRLRSLGLEQAIHQKYDGYIIDEALILEEQP